MNGDGVLDVPGGNPPPTTQERIANALERIADELERRPSISTAFLGDMRVEGEPSPAPTLTRIELHTAPVYGAPMPPEMMVPQPDRPRMTVEERHERRRPAEQLGLEWIAAWLGMDDDYRQSCLRAIRKHTPMKDGVGILMKIGEELLSEEALSVFRVVASLQAHSRALQKQSVEGGDVS